MTARYDWATIEATFDLGGYGGSVVLSDSTALLALIALTTLQPSFMWQGYDDFDDVETVVDLAIAELMGGTAEMGDYVKIAESVAIEDVASLTIDGFDTGTFHTFKLIIQGLKSDENTVFVDHLGMEFNDDDEQNHYSTFARYEDIDTYQRYEYLFTQDFFHCDWFCSSAFGQQAAIGHAEFTIFDPQGDDFKTVEGRSFVDNMTTGLIVNLIMNGVFHSEGEVTKIRIFPVNGTEFKIDPDTAAYPSELRMTLYGLG